jgi:ubiquinone/menaquinone biosynthesis C-methylase UbiE
VDPQSFDHLAARYDRYAELVSHELWTWLRFQLPTRTVRGLDVGCGTGLFTGLLSERCNEVTAVDTSAPMLDYARRYRNRDNIHWLHADLHDLTADVEGRFDVILSTYTLHHVPDLPAALRHLRRLLRPGGAVFLVDAVNPHASTEDYLTRLPRLRAEAWQTFGADVWRHRRPLRHAVELLRLSLDTDWLNHRATDRLLTPEEWDAHTREVFPHAVTHPLHGARTMRWHAPAGGPTP